MLFFVLLSIVSATEYLVQKQTGTNGTKITPMDYQAYIFDLCQNDGKTSNKFIKINQTHYKLTKYTQKNCKGNTTSTINKVEKYEEIVPKLPPHIAYLAYTKATNCSDVNNTNVIRVYSSGCYSYESFSEQYIIKKNILYLQSYTSKNCDAKTTKSTTKLNLKTAVDTTPIYTCNVCDSFN